mmetsp:Transcript_50755/g.135359  ORF Transcript_50755/g.135359 Transcript_50755/m.135359 type:complete len:80 (-) Transcript_50755:88-327(-)
MATDTIPVHPRRGLRGIVPTTQCVVSWSNGGGIAGFSSSATTSDDDDALCVAPPGYLWFATWPASVVGSGFHMKGGSSG